MTYAELGQRVKAKYPDYASVSDEELGMKVAQKHPEYQAMIEEKKQEAPSFLSKVGTGMAKDFGEFMQPTIGAAKGAAETVLNLGNLGTQTLGKIVGADTKSQDQFTENIKQKYLQPTNWQQAGGKLIEQGAELFTPVGIESSAAKLTAKAPAIVKFGSKILASGAENALKTYLQTGGNLDQTKEAGVVGALAPAITEVAKKPLTLIAEKLYQSALKPSTTLGKSAIKDIIGTALKEKVWLTNGGVERAAQKIDDLESKLGDVLGTTKIVNGVETFVPGTATGVIPTTKLKSFVDPIRKFFETVDVQGSKDAQEYIDKTVQDFAEKYPDGIPVGEAQKLKVNTMRYLRSAYGELSSVQKEAQKQITRFLKEGIVEKAPVVGDINARLAKLYALDGALEKASARIGNLNLLGLGSKIGAAAGGKPGAVIGVIADLIDKPWAKSGAAIGLNELAKAAEKVGKAGKVSIPLLMRYLSQQQQGTKSE